VCVCVCVCMCVCQCMYVCMCVRVYIGTCVVSPLSGLAFNTTFTLSCNSYTDAQTDLPLTYSFVFLNERVCECE